VWYEFFTGEQYAVTSISQSVTLAPGEYRLYSDRELPPFHVQATDVSPETEESTGISIFPNPASTKIRIQANEKVVDLQIFTIDGKRIKQLHPNQQTFELSIADLQNGLYLMRINSNQETKNSKFIKTN